MAETDNHLTAKQRNQINVFKSRILQITNQMITASKAYITDNRVETVWSQSMPVVREKLEACIKLNDEYQKHFHKTKVCKCASVFHQNTIKNTL